MKFVSCLLFMILLSSCNLMEWNQSRLSKNFERKNIRERVFTNEEHSIRYFEGGTGETVLLIHGFGGDAQVTWYKTLVDLVGDYHVIAPDLLWFGQSKSSAEANLESQEDAMFDLLKDRNVTNCAIAGISYGGFVVSSMVYRDPDFFSKVCIIDSPGVTYDVSLLDILCIDQKVSSVDEIFVVKNSRQLKALYDLAFYKNVKIPERLMEEAYQFYFSKNHKEQTSLINSLLADADDYLALGKIDFPETTVIWGEYDEVFPLSEGEVLAKFMNAKFEKIEKSGHAPNVEQFKEFEKIFRMFLSN